MRARLQFIVIATGCAVSAATACSSPEPAREASTTKTTQASSVTIEMFDKSGNEMGSCSGTLIAKNLVLTAGHCAAGVAKWKVDSRGADATAEASRAVTPWKKFGSNLSHPDHSDLAVIVLSTPIALDKYPGIATSKPASGAKMLRFSRASATATGPTGSAIEVTSAKSKGFRLNYLAEIEESAFLDTGGAIIDSKTGKIHGVVSGLGKTSGLLHIARTDNFGKWLQKSASCAGATTVRGYPGSSGGSSGSSGGWDNGGDWGGYGGDGKSLDASAPPGTPGADGGTTGGGSSGGPLADGGTGAGGSGDSDDSDDNGGAGETNAGSCPPTPSCEGGDCPGKGGPGTPGSTTPGGDDDDDSTGGGATGTSSSSGGSTPSDEYCPGPPNCPEPDSPQCSGPACGGCGGVTGCVDSTIDYGSCASCGSSSSTGPGPVVR